MHWKDADGNHQFEGSCVLHGGVLRCTFERENFEAHELSHRISDASALAAIEKTIYFPDVITKGPQRGKRNYYRVASYRNVRGGGRIVRLWRVHAFRQAERLYIIATAFETNSSVENAIHYLESSLWKKSGSKI